MKEVSIKNMKLDPVTMFGDKWAVLTAGNENVGYNAMTIAWGNIGTLWERNSHSNRLPVMTVYVRPSRYTKKFMDSESLFTVSTLDDKKALGYLGSHTGRNEDKIKNAGLTPIYVDGTTAIKESEIIFVCRKLYNAPLIKDGFADKELIDFNYPDLDFHEMYVGEIIKVYTKE